MKKEIHNCEICNNKGWIETFVFDSKLISNNTLVIEKCDECNIFTNDSNAAIFAFENSKIFTFKNEFGFNVKIDFSLN